MNTIKAFVLMLGLTICACFCLSVKLSFTEHREPVFADLPKAQDIGPIVRPGDPFTFLFKTDYSRLDEAKRIAGSQRVPSLQVAMALMEGE